MQTLPRNAIPNYFALEFSRRQDSPVLSNGDPYIMYADPNNPHLKSLGFFDDLRIKDDTRKPLDISRFHDPADGSPKPLEYRRYRIQHYILRFNRSRKHKKDLELLQACFTPYYNFFSSPEGSKLLHYWPEKLNKTNYLEPKIFTDSYSQKSQLKVVVPHITGSVLLHALPHLSSKKKVTEVRTALKFAMELSKCFMYEAKLRQPRERPSDYPPQN